mmetsp:Transcript_7731/g.13234  ORF Transcript_7731/g.13234 Transcript_7731/m.13234 type:complete len:235 (-) Transcript_7731:1194-1898(-)
MGVGAPPTKTSRRTLSHKAGLVNHGAPHPPTVHFLHLPPHRPPLQSPYGSALQRRRHCSRRRFVYPFSDASTRSPRPEGTAKGQPQRRQPYPATPRCSSAAHCSSLPRRPTLSMSQAGVSPPCICSSAPAGPGTVFPGALPRRKYGSPIGLDPYHLANFSHLAAGRSSIFLCTCRTSSAHICLRTTISEYNTRRRAPLLTVPLLALFLAKPLWALFVFRLLSRALHSACYSRLR